MTSPFTVTATLIGTATPDIGTWSVATRVTRNHESSQRSVGVELRTKLGLALRHLEGFESLERTSESHRHWCQMAFKSFKLAYLGVVLAIARPELVRSCKRPDVEQVTRAPQARLSLAAA